MKKRKGFVLYIVIAILLGLAILAFALNEFKRGAVIQLAKNVDQNRLIQYCKSANAEHLAYIRSQVNFEPDSAPYKKFRSFFREPPNQTPNFQPETVSLSNFLPNITLDMAKDSGYDIEIECWANVSVFRESFKKGNLAYDGYLDLFSKAYSKSHPESVIEIYERHDVRLVDVRHSFDKYVFFLKYFSPDLNNFNYRIIVEGIDTDSGSGFDPYNSGRISRVYLGTENYSPEQDKDKKENNRIWLDLCFDEIKDMPGFKILFGNTNLTKFSSYTGNNNLFYTKKMKFDNCFGIAEKEFYQVGAVKKIYEEFINNAAYALLRQERGDLKIGEALKNLSRDAMSASESHNPPTTDTAAYRACKDYVEHFKKSTYDGNTVNDYSDCELFKGFLHTCFANWYYEYGYLDANTVWKLTDFSRNKLSDAQDWTKITPNQGGEPYSGLTECNYNGDHKAGGHKCFQSYFNDYKDYNSQRCVVGKMIKLYGRNNRTPVLVEGPVNLRFFKLAYFPSFSTMLPMYSGEKAFVPEFVPILFRRKNREPKTFQSLDCNKDFSSNNRIFQDKDLMSKAIDNIPVNILILKTEDSGPKYLDESGNLTTLDKKQVLEDKFVLPAKATSKANVIDFRRLTHEHSEVSYTYSSPTEFRKDRIRNVKGKESICIDGMMVIKQGDLDLTDIECFYGTGLILLGKGNIKIGNLRKHEGRESDTLRLYISDGSFIVDGSDSDIKIEASLAALYNDKSDDSNKLGRLLLNGKSNVEIYGNLLVDYIKTLDTGIGGLAPGGTLLIKHDPYIVEPSISKGAEIQISIGKVKTAFSIDAGGTAN